jgi:hypothetical protein
VGLWGQVTSWKAWFYLIYNFSKWPATSVVKNLDEERICFGFSLFTPA